MDDSAAAGLRAMGVPEADIQAALDKSSQTQAATDVDFEVYDDCWASVMLFQRVSSQWIYAVASKPVGLASMVFSVKTGLRYEGVEAAMRMLSVPRKEWARSFDDLQTMEQAILRHEAKAA